MKIGVALPLMDIGGQPVTVRAFAEVDGSDHLVAPGNGLGLSVATCRTGASATRRTTCFTSVRAARFPRRLHPRESGSRPRG